MRRVLVTGGAGFVGSNLALEIERRRPRAEVTVLDDFRSGSFKNLIGFRGDVVAKNCVDFSSRTLFDVVFHLASITDTTLQDDREMVHENVEGFRAVLAVKTRKLVYASSAATYGLAEERMEESRPPRPANVYGFSKTILDNLARRRGVGLKYFNVYGPREAHKGRMASMIFQLWRQMAAGRRPRIFKFGEQRRDFVYVKDVVEATLRGRSAPAGLYNVGTGRARSFNDVVAALNQALGTTYEPEYFDNPYDFYQSFTEADLRRSKRLLKYRPQWSLEEGVADYVKNSAL